MLAVCRFQAAGTFGYLTDYRAYPNSWAGKALGGRMLELPLLCFGHIANRILNRWCRIAARYAQTTASFISAIQIRCFWCAILAYLCQHGLRGQPQNCRVSLSVRHQGFSHIPQSYLATRRSTRYVLRHTPNRSLAISSRHPTVRNPHF